MHFSRQCDNMFKNMLTILYRDIKVMYNDFDEVGEVLTGFIEEHGLLEDASTPACGYFENGDELLLEVMEPKIKEVLANMKLEVNTGDGVNEINALECFDEVWEYFYGNENSYCKSAWLINESVENFLAEGEWHLGAICGNFYDCDVEFFENEIASDEASTRPAMYFGVDEPLELWTIDFSDGEEDDELGWGSDLEISDVLSSDPSGCIEFWANECGIYLPSRSKSFAKCPIKINEQISKTELLVSLKEHLRQQKR